MAFMEALLKIKASVDGEGAVTALAKGIGGLKKGAEDASSGLGGMLKSAGGLSGALGSLVPLVSGVGLAAMAKGAIDAADNLNDLSQKTGVSVERLSQFDQAAKMSGTTIDAVGGAMVKLARGMVAAAGATDEYGQTAEQALQDATQAVEDGEDRQVQAVQDAADKRLAALEKESDDRLREINKRYKAEARLLGDSFDDQSRQEADAAKDRQQQEERAIKRSFDARAKAIKDDKYLTDQQKEAKLQALRDEEDNVLKALDRGYQQQQTQRTRQFRDAQQQQEDALEERKRTEEEQIKTRINTEKNLTKEHADGQVKLIKQSSKEQIESLKELAEGPKGVAKALAALGLSAVDASGKMKSTDEVMLEVADKFKMMPDGAKKSALAIQLFGKSGADMIPLLNGGRQAVESLGITMTTKFAKGADDANDKLVVLQTKLLELSVKLGTALMPVLNTITDLVIRMATGFSSLPDWMQGTIAAVGGLVIALGSLVQILSGAMVVIKGIAALQLGATIASWAAALGPAMGVISAAFSGLLAFLSGTVLPALLAFFSGPVGWTALAVAAVVAMAIAFREPLGKFITWLGSVFKKGWDGFVKNILEKPVKAYFKWWRSNWESAVKFVTGLFSGIAKALKAPLDGIVSILRNTLRLAFRNLENAFNAFVLRYNNLVANLKKSPFGGILGLIPTIPLLNIPKFAQGGLVTKPTIAMVGEGGQDEFILPESKLKDFAQLNAELSWRRLLNSAWLRSLQPTTRSDITRENFKRLEQQITDLGLTGSAPNKNLLVDDQPKQLAIHQNNTFDVDPIIQITTGPVIQFDNQRFVTLDEFEAGLRTAVRSVFDSLRNPATRIQLGLS
jgi:hypothetical protein